MVPINIDLFVNQVKEIVENPKPSEEKIDSLAKLIETHSESLNAYSAENINPEVAEKFEKLANRISSFEGSKQKIEHVAKTLKNYSSQLASSPSLPSEVMNLIVDSIVQTNAPKEWAALLQTSKQTRIQAIQAIKSPLKELNINDEGKLLEFARNYGQFLTYIDISEIPISLFQLSQLMPLLPNLTVLIAESCGFTLVEAEILARSLPNLQSLNLNNNLIERGGIAIAQSLLNLRSLSLDYNGIDDDGAVAIASLKKLRSLSLYGNHVGNEGAAAIAQLPLQALFIGSTRIGEEGARALADSEALNSLKSLGISLPMIPAIASSKHIKNLRVLDISPSYPEEAEGAARTIAESKNFEDLEKLRFYFSFIGDNGAASLAHSPNLSKLRSLILQNCAIHNEGAIAIASSSQLSQLEELDLSENDIGEEGEVAIAESQNFTHLKRLNLGILRDPTAVALANSRNFPSLQEIDLSESSTSAVWAIAASRNLKNLHTIKCDPEDEEATFAASQRKALSALTDEQWDQLLKKVGKEQLFEDPKRFESALKEIL